MSEARVTVMRGTTDASGDAVVDSETILGEVIAVFVDGAALTDSANLTLVALHPEVAGTSELGENIISHADVGNSAIDKIYPRRLATDNAGTTLAVATGVNVAVPYAVPGGKLRATISAGGDSKAFSIHVMWR